MEPKIPEFHLSFQTLKISENHTQTTSFGAQLNYKLLVSHSQLAQVAQVSWQNRQISAFLKTYMCISYVQSHGTEGLFLSIRLADFFLNLEC